MRKHQRLATTKPNPFSWRRLQTTQGSGLIELAFVMPVFLLLTFGFINFSLILYGWCNITYGARAASRYLSLNDPNYSFGTPDPQTMTAVTNMMKPFLPNYPMNTTTTNVTVGWGSNSRSSYAPAALVSITVTYKMVLPGYTYSGPTIQAQSQNYVLSAQPQGPNNTW